MKTFNLNRNYCRRLILLIILNIFIKDEGEIPNDVPSYTYYPLMTSKYVSTLILVIWLINLTYIKECENPVNPNQSKVLELHLVWRAYWIPYILNKWTNIFFYNKKNVSLEVHSSMNVASIWLEKILPNFTLSLWTTPQLTTALLRWCLPIYLHV